MAETPSGQGRWAFRPIPPEQRSIVALIRDGTLDAELAALLWILIEARVPVIVAAAARSVGKTTLLRALLDFVPSAVNVVELRGVDETFDWLPQATELGWPGTARRAAAGPPVRPDNTILLAPELSDHTPAYIWGDAARVAVRAAAIGYGLAATIHGDSLDDVFATLRGAPVRLTDDELSRLGVVLVLRRDQRDVRRIVAAHYVRPVVRDEHGHVQRLGPAVLATWDPAGNRFEHFGWGIIPELAMRVGRRPGDLEMEIETRRALLDALVASGVTDVAAVRGAIERYVVGAAASASGERPPTPPS
jgi:flagellar protein FlaI